MITFLYPWVIYAGLPIIVCVVWWHTRGHKAVLYQLPLTGFFAQSLHLPSHHYYRIWRGLSRGMRVVVYMALLLATARPQYPDQRSKVKVEGVATMLVLDVSGSMECFDDLNDQKKRFESAREEAIRFVERRSNDLLGLIIFGAVAASRCPLTSDKKIVIDILKDIKIGVVNHDGTMLGMAIALGVKRLSTSTCQSKIMILLTDGTPSPGDLDPRAALELAKKAGIKIYTIGIGSDAGGFMHHPMGGIVQIPTPLNRQLLTAIAQETGGMFFHAASQKDLANIYQHIDTLEKSSHDAPVYASYYELYMPLVLLAFVLLAIEILITSCFWIAL